MRLSDPVSDRELSDILKSDRSLVCLFIYVSLVGLAIFAGWPKSEDHFTVSTELARVIFQYFVFSQMLLVSVMAPVFAASSLTREKEEETWELLIASPIPVQGIIKGKYQAALGYLALVLCSSLPVALLLPSLGGISSGEVLALYGILAGMGILFVGIGLICSAYYHRTHSSLVVSYLFILPVASPLSLYIASDPGRALGGMIFPQVTLLMCVAAAVFLYQKVVVHAGSAFMEPPKPATEEETSDQNGLVLRADRFPDMLLLPEKNGEPIGMSENPIYRKELRSELLGTGTLFVRMVFQIAIFGSLIFIFSVVTGQTQHLISYLMVVMGLITPALASGSFSQEQERGNLEALMTTMLTPRQIVTGKLQALVRYALMLTFFLLVAHLVTLLFAVHNSNLGFTQAMRSAVHIVVLISALVTAATVSAAYSLRTMMTFSATILTYVTLVVLYAGPFCLHKLLEIFSSQDLASIRWVTFTSPFGPLLLAPHEELWMASPGLWHAHVLFNTVLTVMLVRWMTKRTAQMMNFR